MALHAPVRDREGDLIAGYTTHQLDAIRNAAFGLTDEQVRQRTTASELSIGSVIKHTTRGTAQALERVRMAPKPQTQMPGSFQEALASHLDTFDPHEPIADLLAELDAVRAEVEEVVPSLDLDQRVPVPPGAPWWPQDVESWPVRWDLLHWVEELARHAGHADIIREQLDGAVAGRLLAAAEGWPKGGWIEPWEPADTAARATSA